MLEHMRNSDRSARIFGDNLASPRPAALGSILMSAAESTLATGIIFIDSSGVSATYPYRQLLHDAGAVLAGLRALGMQAGDHAIIQHESNRLFLISFWACVLGGIIPVLPSLALNHDPATIAFQKLVAVSDLLGRPYVLTSRRLIGVGAPAAPNQLGQRIAIDDLLSGPSTREWHKPEPEAIAVLGLTSGSTGQSKLVMLSHANVISQVVGVIQQRDLGPKDRSLNWMALDHIGSLCTHIRDVYLGCLQLQVAMATILEEPLRWIDWMAQYRVTMTRAPNFAYKLVNDRAAEIAARQWDLSCVRFMINAGEAIIARVAQQFLATLAPFGLRPDALAPCWGMTETSSGVTYSDSFARRSTATTSFVALGKPLPGVGIRIVDDAGALVNMDEPGHVQVCGLPLCAGYYRNPQATAEAWTEDGWFITGDIGMLSDGELTLTGRAKDVIIVKGVNYHSYEIEALVEEIPTTASSFVAACAVRSQEHGDSDKLAIFFGTQPTHTDSDIDQLAMQIRRTVAAAIGIQPQFLVPLPCDSFPKTSLGKIQRKLLAQQFQAGAYRTMVREYAGSAPDRSIIPPRDEAEQQLAQIWQHAFDRADISIDDDFFALGGDSILTIRIIAQIQQTLKKDVSAADIFLHATIEQLAAHLTDAGTSKAPSLPPIEPAHQPLGEPPLSYAQQRLYFLWQLQPQSPFYTIPTALRLRGTLDEAALARAIESTLQQHEALRMWVQVADDTPYQAISPTCAPLQVSDLSSTPAEQQAALLQQLLAADAQTTFDLARGPLYRFHLIRCAAHEHVLVAAMHHIITDGWSMEIFWGDLAQHYNAHHSGRARPAAPPTPASYRDFAVWQAACVRDGSFQKQLAYWQARLGAARTILELPTDRTRPAVADYHGDVVSLQLPEDLAAALRGLSKNERCTLFMTLLSAFFALLHRYSRQQHIVIGTPSANRTQPSLQRVIGSFSNPLALDAHLAADISFQALLHQVRETVLQAYENQDVPFELVVDAVQPQRDPSRQPLFQAMFIFQNGHDHQLQFDRIDASFLGIHSGTSKMDLSLFVSELDSGLDATIEYDTALFTAQAVARMLGHLQMLLRQVVANPSAPIGSIPLLTPDEVQTLRRWNETAIQRTATSSVHRLVEQQAARSPHAVAVVYGDKQISYQALNERAAHVAQNLRAHGVGPDSIVGLAVSRSIEQTIAILGILKAGGAYMPIDPAYPQERRCFMLADARPRVLLTDTLDDPWWGGATWRGDVCLLSAMLEPQPAPTPIAAAEADGESLLYVLYTSGSTGQPKGVGMPHRSIVNLIMWQRQATVLEHPARTLQFSALSFDVSCQEIFFTWAEGGTLVVIDEELRRDAVRLLQQLSALKIQRLFLPFVALQHIAQVADEQGMVRLPELGEIITAGEQLQATPEIRRFLEICAPAVLHNQYGPTETHVVTAYTLAGDPACWPTLPPIGKPIDNTQIFLLDDQGAPVPIGVPGEIYVGGLGLARGYLGRPDLTAERFCPSPLAPGNPQAATATRLYRTGDLARYREDGAIVFLGRADDQIKIRGYRIEPGEIACMLRLHPQVHEAVIRPYYDDLQELRLAAYLILTPTAESMAAATAGGAHEHSIYASIRSFLAAQLPPYMIPSVLIAVSALPLTPSGKLDWNALPQPRHTAPVVSAAPRTPLERAVCGIWSDLLATPAVGVDDSFFELGGHSLLATHLVMRIAKTFRVAFSLAMLLRKPTVSGTCAELLAIEPRPGWMLKIADIWLQVASMSESESAQKLGEKQMESEHRYV